MDTDYTNDNCHPERSEEPPVSPWPARAVNLIIVTVHGFVAMGLSTAIGFACLFLVLRFASGSENPLLDFPYSPFLWGSALILGILLARGVRNQSGKRVWLVGLLWMVLFVVPELFIFDRHWCLGCSRWQWVWDSYFRYHNCEQECLGQLFATAPMLNAFAYSLGAMLAARRQRRTTTLTGNETAGPSLRSG